MQEPEKVPVKVEIVEKEEEFDDEYDEENDEEESEEVDIEKAEISQLSLTSETMVCSLGTPIHQK